MENVRYNFVDPAQVARELADRWWREGYASIWLRSDGKISKSRRMIGHGDDYRVEDGPSDDQLTARRIALCNPEESVDAIVGAIALGQPIPEIAPPTEVESEPTFVELLRKSIDLSVAKAQSSREIVPVPVIGSYACPMCGDPCSFCDCDQVSTIGRRAA